MTLKQGLQHAELFMGRYGRKGGEGRASGRWLKGHRREAAVGQTQRPNMAGNGHKPSVRYITHDLQLEKVYHIC